MAKIKNNIELNIQLQTISGAMRLGKMSTIKRNTLIEGFNEDLQTLKNLIGDNEKYQPIELIEFLTSLYDRVQVYVSNYGEAVSVLESQISEFDEVYEALSYQDAEPDLFSNYMNKLEKNMFDKVLGEPFIDENSYLEEKDNALSKMKNNDIKKTIETFTDLLDAYFVDISEQNEMISSVIELIETVKNEVK